MRGDRRHIQDADVQLLCRRSPLPINLEMAATDEMLKMALLNKPSWVCFVPEKREELTTEGGLNVLTLSKPLQQMTAVLQSKKIKVSYFIDPDLKQVRAAAEANADAVEFHTGQWVLSQGARKKQDWKDLQQAAVLADQLGLRVHAGHGLDFEHTNKIKQLSHLVEVNIGHSLICYSLEMGLKKAVQQMKKQLVQN